MSVVAFQIMKYYRKFFTQLKINITIPMTITSIFFYYIIMTSYFIISFSNQSITYQHLLLDSFSSSADMTRLLLKCFVIIFCNIHFFKNCFNKFIECNFYSAKNNWHTKSLINAYNFTSKPTSNMSFKFYGIRGITIFYHGYKFFLNQIQNQHKS